MVRMSDILKRVGQKPKEQEPEEEKKTLPPEENLVQESLKESEGVQISKAMAKKEGISEEEQKMNIAKALAQTQLDPEQSHNIYNQGLELMRQVLNKAKNNEPIELKEVNNLIENIVDRMVLGDNELLSLTVNHSKDNYLISHSLNVAILSIEVGLGKGYNKSKLNELALSAILHDIGMIKVIDIANQPRRLTKEEYAKIKQHPVFGAEILTKIKDINQSAVYAAQEHHERLSGNGYPQNLSNGKISDYSQIISLCDIYEALTHPRPYRKQMDGYESIREILSADAGQFDTQNIKIFIKKLGVFPIGSWVELVTGEIGKVVSSNEDFPLRPVVNVFFDINKRKYPEIKTINLAKHHSIYIKKPVNLQELGLNL